MLNVSSTRWKCCFNLKSFSEPWNTLYANRKKQKGGNNNTAKLIKNIIKTEAATHDHFFEHSIGEEGTKKNKQSKMDISSNYVLLLISQGKQAL